MAKRKYSAPNEFSTTKQPRPYDLYIETPFSSLIDELRDMSSDNTPLTDNYVSFERNVKDMISSDDDQIVTSFTYNEKTNTIHVVYANGNEVSIPLVEYYLKQAIFYPDRNAVVMTINNGEKVVLDLTKLADKFYTKEEIDKKIDSIDSINWKLYN